MVAHVAVAAVARAGAAGARVAATAGRAGVAAGRAGVGAARGAANAAKAGGAATRTAGRVGQGAARGAGRVGQGAARTGRGAARAGSRTSGRAHGSQRNGRGRARDDPTLRRVRKHLDRGGGDRSRRHRARPGPIGPGADPEREDDQAARTTDAGTHLRRGAVATVAAARAIRHPFRMAGRAVTNRLGGLRSGRKRVGVGGSGKASGARRWVVLGIVVFLVFGMISSVPLLMPSFGSGNVPDNAGATLTNADSMEEAFVEAGVPEEYADDFVATANLGIDPRLVAAVAWQESVHFDEDVIACERDSPAGAKGIMQFMPDTAREREVDPCRPGEAITAGARYLLEIYEKFGNWDVTLAGYNAGPHGEVDSCRCVPTNGETEDYVPAVNGKWAEYKRTVPEPRFEGPRPSGANPGGPQGSTERYTESRITPTMQAVLDAAIPLFGQGRGVGCFRNGTSGEHPLGRACDFIISSPLNTRPEPDWLEHGWRFACWLVQNAETLKVRYVIWQKLIWEEHRDSQPDRRCTGNRSGDGWAEYTRYGPSGSLQQNHYDHIHVTVN